TGRRGAPVGRRLVPGAHGEARVPAGGGPGRKVDEAVQEAAVAAGGDRVGGLVAAVVVDEAAARGRVVALAAADGARRQLELRVGARGGRRGDRDDGETGRPHG